MVGVTRKRSEAVNRMRKGRGQIEKADISPTGTVSVTGEIAQGLLGAFSLGELL